MRKKHLIVIAALAVFCFLVAVGWWLSADWTKNAYGAQDDWVIVQMDKSAKVAFDVYKNGDTRSAIEALKVFVGALASSDDLKTIDFVIVDEDLLDSYMNYGISMHARLARLYEKSGADSQAAEEVKIALQFAKHEVDRMAKKGIKDKIHANITNKDALFYYLTAADQAGGV